MGMAILRWVAMLALLVAALVQPSLAQHYNLDHERAYEGAMNKIHKEREAHQAKMEASRMKREEAKRRKLKAQSEQERKSHEKRLKEQEKQIKKFHEEKAKKLADKQNKEKHANRRKGSKREL